MRPFLIIVMVLSFLACGDGSPEKITTYYFIRHAEKDVGNPKDEDPSLTEEGRKRTERWVEVFKAVPFDLVFASQYKRTQETASPIADFHDLPVQTYSTSKLNDEEFQEETKGKTVLVVGHTDINPEFVNYILGKEKYETIEKTEHGSLFIVTVGTEGEKSSQVLYIN